MRRIEFTDVLDIAQYERNRPDIRKEILQIKSQRRIAVGPAMTYLFENFATMWYQIHEMMRAERIVKKEAILQEIRVYNELVPENLQLSATLFIASGDAEQDKQLLHELIDLPQHTFLVVDGCKILAHFDVAQIGENRISSVQYVKFNVDERQAALFLQNESDVRLVFDHPAYMFEHTLTFSEKKVLYEDMTDIAETGLAETGPVETGLRPVSTRPVSTSQ